MRKYKDLWEDKWKRIKDRQNQHKKTKTKQENWKEKSRNEMLAISSIFAWKSVT